MTIKEYKKEFYRISISFKQNEESLESIMMYVNGWICSIQDEFDVLNFHSVEKTYLESLIIEDKF